MRKIILPLFIALTTISCGRDIFQLPLAENVPDHVDRRCIDHLAQGEIEWLDVGGLPMFKPGHKVRVINNYSGPSRKCFDWSYGLHMRLSEPVEVEINPDEPRLCISAEEWQRLNYWLRLYGPDVAPGVARAVQKRFGHGRK